MLVAQQETLTPDQSSPAFNTLSLSEHRPSLDRYALTPCTTPVRVRLHLGLKGLSFEEVIHRMDTGEFDTQVDVTGKIQSDVPAGKVPTWYACSGDKVVLFSMPELLQVDDRQLLKIDFTNLLELIDDEPAPVNDTFTKDYDLDFTLLGYMSPYF